MIHFFEATVFVVYSFLAPIITAGGGMLVSNALHIGLPDIDLVKATGLTSSYFLVNSIIVISIFRRDIVWREVVNILPATIVGAFIGATILVNIGSIYLLIFMFGFSIYFIYKKVKITGTTAVRKDSALREKFIGFLGGAITGSALPGGGFLNSYFGSKGFTLQQMFGTLNMTLIFVWIVKVSVMVNAGILVPTDFIGVLIAFPFLIGSNYLLRHGLIKLSKSVTDTITILAMSLFSLYSFFAIITSSLK